MRMMHTLLTGVLLLGAAAPSWGQYPYRPYQRPYSPQRPVRRHYYSPPPIYDDESLPPVDPGQQQDGRHMWVYGNRGEGSFRQLRDGTWVESNSTGQYHFREVARTPQYIDLFDASRGAFARLTDRIMYSHGLGDVVWHRGYTGQWE